MSQRLSQQERTEPFYDPQGEAAAYVRAMAAGQVFDLRSDPIEWLAPDRDLPEILRKAIGLEKDSIVFYLGIREAVPERLGKDWVDDIVREEMGHVRLLDEQMRAATD
jgi:rubrerythrin